MANDANIEIGVEFDPIFGERIFKKASEDAGKKSAKSFGKGFKKNVTRSLRGSLGSIRGQLIGIGAAFGAAFAFRGALNAAKAVEQIETQLKILTGSAEAAAVVLSDLQEFATRTPFQLQGIAQAANQLIAFGFSAGDVVERLQKIGDVAAGSNSQLKEIALIFGQVSAAGKLTGERLLQLQERAIPIGPAIAKTMGVATSEVKKLVSEGKVGFAVFEEAFNSLSAAGGLFEGALIAQSKTIGGVLSTLGDNFEFLQASIGKAFGPAIIASAGKLIDIFKKFSADVVANGPVLLRTFNRLAEIFVITPAPFWLDFFAGDSAKSLNETTAEIARLEEKLGAVGRRLKATKGSTLADLFGGRTQALQDLGDLSAQLTELIKLRDELTAAQGTNTEAIRAELAAKAELKKAQDEESKSLADQLALKAEIAEIGLTDLERLEEKFKTESELLRRGLEEKALTEEEFQARSLESRRQFEAQAAGIAKKGLDEAAKRTKKLENIVSQSLSQATTRGIQALTNSLIIGKNGFANFGQAIIGILGDLATRMGQVLLFTGIGMESLGNLTGSKAVIAGIGLIALGTILKSASGGAGAGTGGGVGALGGGDGGGFAGTDDTGVITEQQEEREAPAAQIQVTIQGDVLDSEETGTRLVQILNDSFEQDGIVVTNGAFA